ncbi:MAG: hypothetical protein ACP5JR_06625 [Thermoplasmata archaeon]
MKVALLYWCVGFVILAGMLAPMIIELPENLTDSFTFGRLSHWTYPYQTDGNGSDHGNPFENFTPEQLFNTSSPLGFIGYISMFFCLGIPIMLLIVLVCVIAIFVRLGKIRKELSQLNKKWEHTQYYTQPVQTLQPSQHSQMTYQQNPQPVPQTYPSVPSTVNQPQSQIDKKQF